jgi:hypothetical protein
VGGGFKASAATGVGTLAVVRLGSAQPRLALLGLLRHERASVTAPLIFPRRNRAGSMAANADVEDFYFGR